MSISEAVTKRRRRSFSPEFKREIVSLCQLPDNTVTSVCKEYDLGETAVRRWVHQADVDAGVKPGVSTNRGARPVAQATARRHRRAGHPRSSCLEFKGSAQQPLQGSGWR
jgi:transposase